MNKRPDAVTCAVLIWNLLILCQIYTNRPEKQTSGLIPERMSVCSVRLTYIVIETR